MFPVFAIDNSTNRALRDSESPSQFGLGNALRIELSDFGNDAGCEFSLRIFLSFWRSWRTFGIYGPFIRCMAFLAKANEVAKLVGFAVVREITESPDVMNIQLLSKFGLSNAALLAGVVVTPTHRPSLPSPVRAIVTIVATIVRIVRANVALCIEFSHASQRTGDTHVEMTLLYDKFFAANETGFSERWGLGNFCRKPLALDLLTARTLPVVVTGNRTKPATFSGWLDHVWLAALLTGRFVGGGFPTRDVRNGEHSGTSAAATFARPGFSVSELFAAISAMASDLHRKVSYRLTVGTLAEGALPANRRLEQPI
jgi:hypothetical protein